MAGWGITIALLRSQSRSPVAPGAPVWGTCSGPGSSVNANAILKRASAFTVKFRVGYRRATRALWKGSKAAGAWAVPAALPSSPMAVAVFPDGNCWGSELKTSAKAEIPSPNQRIIHTTVRPTFIGFRRCQIALWV
jgi:hypothetical protein